MKHTLNDKVTSDYSKLIFGFSMSRTKNLQDAQDQSQEILISLFRTLKGKKDIADLNAYVYTICCYTWSKFLRRNKCYFNSLSIECLEHIGSSTQVDEEIFHSIDLQRLRRELSYLTELHRRITIMHYFEKRSCDEIGKVLIMSNESVRRHLFESRKKMR